MRVQRFDLSSFQNKPEITPQGYLKADAYATRTGIFTYQMGDGTVRREFRSPDQVFNPDSMNSLANIAITNDHPIVPLNPDNTKQYAVGFTGSEVGREGDFLGTKLIITDAKTIQDIMSRNKEQLSCGYHCDVIMKTGTYNGEDYDAVQQNIIHNHLAIVPEGRAGPDAKVKLDSTDAIMMTTGVMKTDERWTSAFINNLPDSCFAYIEPGGDKDSEGKTTPRSLRHFPYKNKDEEIDLPHLRNTLARAPQSPFGKEAMPELIKAKNMMMKSGEMETEAKKDDGQEKKYTQEKNNLIPLEGQEIQNDKKGVLQMAKIKIDSVEYEISEGVAPLVSSKIQKLDEAEKSIQDLKAENSKLQGKCDGLNSELKAKSEEIEKVKTDSKLSSKQIVEIGRARISLEETAKKVLGEETKIDSMEDLEIQKAVISKLKADCKLDGKDASYIQGMFDIVQASLKSDKSEGFKSALINTMTSDGSNGDDGIEKARLAARERAENAWKKK